MVLTLNSEAAQVSGTMLAADGKTEYPLKDTKLDGDNFSFTVDSEWQGNPVKLIAKAKLRPTRFSFTSSQITVTGARTLR